jgi:uncharacterized protein YjbI with pentapeptide repeats
MFLVKKTFYVNLREGLYPTGVLWFIGVYFSIFTVADTMYQNRLENMESRFSYLVNYAGFGYYRIFFNEFDKLKNSEIPLKPELGKVWGTVKSLAGEKVLFSQDEDLMKNLNQEFSFTIKDVDLDNMVIKNINLRNSTFDGTNLHETMLFDCNLRNVKFIDTGHSHGGFIRCNLDTALFHGSGAFKGRLDSCYMYGVVFEDVTGFFSCSFKNSYCRKAKFEFYDIGEADFSGSDLTEADLSVCRYCPPIKTINGLLKAKSLAGAKFSDGWMKVFRTKYPEIIEKINEPVGEVISSDEFFNLLK